MSPDSSAEEYQTSEERREVSRRYREKRGRELKGLAATAVGGEVIAAGEFSSVPTEALAAVPGLGMLMLPFANRRARRTGLGPKLMLALDDDSLYGIGLKPADLRRDRSEATVTSTWPRGECSIERAGRIFMRDRVLLTVPGREEPMTLYAPPLITNPWSSEVVRLLGGKAPDPLDLSGS